MQTTDEGANNLVCAIVRTAVVDYTYALVHYNTAKNVNKKNDNAYRISECELFFRKKLKLYCEIDGEMIIDRIRQNTKEKLLKEKGIVMEVPGDDRTAI